MTPGVYYLTVLTVALLGVVWALPWRDAVMRIEATWREVWAGMIGAWCAVCVLALFRGAWLWLPIPALAILVCHSYLRQRRIRDWAIVGGVS
jgi:hypothetical protein